MRLTPQNKERVRQRILAGAGPLFRDRGYDDVNIDRIMEAAGLTRGAFYAHFKSKAQLFGEVLRNDHPLLTLLRARDGQTQAQLWEQTMAIFAAYLNPQNLPDIFSGCTVASLTGVAARADDSERIAFEQGWLDIREEMQRGLEGDIDSAAMDSALLLATNAVTTAWACQSGEQRRRILASAQSGFNALMEMGRTPSQ